MKKPKPRVKPKPKPRVKPKPKPRVKPKPKPRVKPKPKPRVKPKPKPRVKPKPKPKPRVKPRPGVKAKVKALVKPKVKPAAKAEVKRKTAPKPKVIKAKPKKVGEEEVLKLIRASKSGVAQNELWKKLGIDSRACSRYITSLEARGLIKRERVAKEKIRTYRIFGVKQIVEPPKPVAADHHLIVAKDIVAPCVGCKAECDPELCGDLSEWVRLLY